jgi:hypothetical protein
MTTVHLLQSLQRDSVVARLVCRLEVILKGLVLLSFWFAFTANT